MATTCAQVSTRFSVNNDGRAERFEVVYGGMHGGHPAVSRWMDKAVGGQHRAPRLRAVSASCGGSASSGAPPTMPLTAPGHRAGTGAPSPAGPSVVSGPSPGPLWPDVAAGICWRSTRRWARASSGPGSTQS